MSMDTMFFVRLNVMQDVWGFKMTEEEIMKGLDDGEAMWAEVSRLEVIEVKKLDAIKLRVKELAGSKFYALFCEYIENFKTIGSMWSWEITTKKPHIRKPQEIDEIDGKSRLTHEYVDQYRNGGMEGDDFGGQVWLHIKGNRYFTFHYSM